MRVSGTKMHRHRTATKLAVGDEKTNQTNQTQLNASDRSPEESVQLSKNIRSRGRRSFVVTSAVKDPHPASRILIAPVPTRTTDRPSQRWILVSS